MLAFTSDIRSLVADTETYEGFNSAGGYTLGILVGSIFSVAIVLSALAMVAYIIWGGYTWLTAGDKPDQAEQAQTMIRNAIMGLAIVAAALALGVMVNTFFGTGLSLDRDEASPGGITECSGIANRDYCASTCGSGCTGYCQANGVCVDDI